MGPKTVVEMVSYRFCDAKVVRFFELCKYYGVFFKKNAGDAFFCAETEVYAGWERGVIGVSGYVGPVYCFTKTDV